MKKITSLFIIQVKGKHVCVETISYYSNDSHQYRSKENMVVWKPAFHFCCMHWMVFMLKENIVVWKPVLFAPLPCAFFSVKGKHGCVEMPCFLLVS